MTPRERLLAAVHQRRFGRFYNPAIPRMPAPGQLPGGGIRPGALQPVLPAGGLFAAAGAGAAAPAGAPAAAPAAPPAGAVAPAGGAGWNLGGVTWPLAGVPAVTTTTAVECSYDPDDGTVTCGGKVYSANVVQSGTSGTGGAMVLVTSPAFAASRWVEVAPKRNPTQTTSTYSLQGVTGAMQMWQSPLSRGLALARMGVRR